MLAEWSHRSAGICTIFLSIQTTLSSTAYLLIICAFAMYSSLVTISLTDLKYPKFTRLLCATPYLRNSIVFSRYLFFFFEYIGIVLILEVESAFFPGIQQVGFSDIIKIFLVVAVFLGVYFPLQYKFGYEMTKYILMALVLIGTLYSNYIGKFIIKHFSGLLNNTSLLTLFVCVISSGIILSISIWISIAIFKAKEL